EIGMADGVANGNFGPGTQAGLKSSGGISSGSSDGGTAFVSLFQLALAFNGYDVTRSGVFSAATRTTTLDFQRFLEIAATGDGDYGTWAALLVSTGDPDRPVSMIDTTSTMSPAFSAQMKQAGYDIVGRYLTVTGKAIARGELDTIFTAGLRVVPIFQNFNNGPEYFTRALGLDHGRQAAIRARQLGFQGGTTIFFAVDYDAFATEIDLLIAPYFQGVAEGLSVSVEKKYGVGVYATRNIGARIAERGLASSVWVSGMSTGYSGNLGFAMPPTWSYNQIQEVHSLNIDRNAVSSRARPATRADVARTPEQSDAVRSFFWALVRHSVYAESAVSKQPLVPSTAASEFVLDRLMEAKYHDVPWLAYAPYAESTPGMPPQTALAYTTARIAYLADAGDIRDIIDNYDGDAEHMAATARTAKLWGTSAGSSAVEFGDLGGWSLDLVTLWKSYRLSSQKAITAFVNQHLGAPGSPAEFPEDDLIADADGWLLAKGMMEGKSVADAFQALLVSSTSWRDRLGLFLDGRFGSPATLSAAVATVFGPTWPWPGLPRYLFLGREELPNASELVELRSAVTTRLYLLAGRSATP
ncbi:MAG: hypothetical protein JWP75_2949, partial [Frondihabitans sp.]|nr:hypothetical protein [Frondihabitans sp.]